MEVSISKEILAMVTKDKTKVSSGSVPIFYAENDTELEQVTLYLARIFMAAIHDLSNGVYIIVRH